MMKVDRFAAPGNLTDFDNEMADGWSRFISDGLDREAASLLQSNPGIQPQFYNPAKLDVSGSPTPISWLAFPAIIEAMYADDPQRMFEEAEKRDNQDEYLEWSVVKENGKIKRVMFTCEGPEYWSFIARNRPDLLVALYTKIVGQEVPQRDLITPQGVYFQRNKWNIQHAVHLVQPNNNLRAEINIAAKATVLRRHGGHNPVTDNIELIDCSGYGVKERNSDPHIGDVVNQKARAGCSVTLENPVGLYIESLPKPSDKWLKPDGSPVGDYWTLERGDKDHIVRAVYEVPAGELSAGAPFVVGDIRIAGKNIEFGGHIVKAALLQIKLSGVIGKEGVFHNITFPCPNEGGSGMLDALAPNPFSRQG
jgi:hypothetical protein